MTHWYPLEPADDDFLRTAPAVTTKVIEVGVPVETLWEALAADDAVVSWGPGVTKVQWLGGRPFGSARSARSPSAVPSPCARSSTAGTRTSG